MKLYIYVKHTEDISEFAAVVQFISSGKNDMDIEVICEARRSFRELDAAIVKCNITDIVVVYSLESLGLNEADIANRLETMISLSKMLVVCSEESTYEFGVSQPMNKAVLKSLQKRYLSATSNVMEIPKNRRSNSGRNKLPFPENWEELYTSWSNREITSKEFIERSGLKKASFYNLLTEYKNKIDRIDEFKKYYRCI